MNGSIEFESTCGQGSVFRVRVPLSIQPGAGRTVTPIAVGDLAGRCVYVADDNKTNRDLLLQLLCRWHMRGSAFDSANSFMKALDAACAEGVVIDLCIVDYQMPDMHGVRLINQMRQRAEMQDIPVILLSSVDQIGAISQLQNPGHIITTLKPVMPTDLLNHICHIFGAAGPSAAHMQTSAAQQVKQRYEASQHSGPFLKILVAEDNSMNQKLISTILQKRGHEVALAENGAEVLEYLHEHNYFQPGCEPGDKIDLILMDVQMPKMSGEAATQAIRQHEKDTKRHIPIVALTAHALKGDRERYLGCGMDDYLTKPIDTKALFALLDDMQRSLDATTPRPLARRKPAAGAAVLSSPRRGAASERAKKMFERLDGNIGLLMEIIEELYSKLDANRSIGID